MIEPTMPTTRAIDDPDSWDHYWSERQRYETHLKNKERAPYRQAYYAKRTEQRQIEKMKELMVKYPTEARDFLVESK